jgi:hypothetical protein
MYIYIYFFFLVPASKETHAVVGIFTSSQNSQIEIITTKIMVLGTGVSARHLWVMPVILATQEAQIRRTIVQSQPGQIVRKTLSQKVPNRKSAGRVAQVVEFLSRKHKTLSSNPSTTTPPPKKKSWSFWELIRSSEWSPHEWYQCPDKVGPRELFVPPG